MKKAIALLLTFVTLLSFADAKNDLAAEDLHLGELVQSRNIMSLRDLCNRLLHKFTIGISCCELCHIFQVSHGVAGGVRGRNFDVGGKVFNKFAA